MDVSEVLEEIALEGLDGITLNALWLRLKTRPGFHFESIDKYVKQYVWKHICQSTAIEFFQLENPRPELVITNFDSLVIENRCWFKEEYPPDIYSIKMVDKNGIYGCCDVFDSRVVVTGDIRSDDGTALMTVEQAMERWGQKLTIVASQKLRFQALLSTNYLPTGISAEAYTVLERVGRSRYIGEPSKVCDRPGLVNEMMTLKNLFAVLKHLCGRGYLVKQDFNTHVGAKGKNFHSKIIHLRRFYRRTTANTAAYINSVCDFLQGRPKMMAPSEAVMEKYGLRFKDITRHVGPSRSPIAIELVSYRSVFPDATEDEYMDKNGQEKTLKVLRLTQPYVSEDGNDEEDKDDEERDEVEEYPDDSLIEGSPEALAGQYLYDRSIPATLTLMIAQSGINGIAESQIRRRLHAPPKMLEHALRALLKAKVISKFAQQLGTIRFTKYRILEAAERQPETEKGEEQGYDDELNTSQDSNFSQELLQEDADIDSKEEKEHIDAMIRSLNFSWVIEKEVEPCAPLEEMTLKMKQRRAYILKILAKKRVYTNKALLCNEMIEWERGLGWKERMCRKSFARILKDLYMEGKVSHVKLSYTSSSEQKRLQFLGDINLKEDELTLKKEALRHYTYSIKYQTVKSKQIPQVKDDPEAFSQPVSVCDLLQKAAGGYKAKKIESKSNVKMKHDLCPKGEKGKLLHEFMFYLLYDYRGDPNAADDWKQDGERTGPPVYLDVRDWRRYLPPLKIHNIATATEIIPGSCMIGDLLVSMPTYIFCKLVHSASEIEGLKEILDDEDKKLYPLNQLPSNLLGKVLKCRSYLQKVNCTISLLCFLGLLSYGPRVPTWKKVEYNIVYLHKKALVLNTTISLPSYDRTVCPTGKEFEKIRFHFDSLEKIQEYWREIYLISTGSKLGLRGFLAAKTTKPNQRLSVNLMDVRRPRKLNEIQEDDWLPGDRRGACGFDSSLFMHLQRCWKYKSSIEANRKKIIPAPLKRSSSVTAPRVEGPIHRKIKRVHFDKPKKTAKIVQKETKRLRRKRRSPTSTEGPKKKHVRNSRVLDEEDEKAKKQMPKMRSQFSPLENGMILIFHVAYIIMYPSHSGLSVPHKAIRISVREFLPDVFKDKTQHAIKTRFTRYPKDKNIKKHIVFYLTKAKYDQELISRYSNAHGGLALKENFTKYMELVKELFYKFSSPDDPLPFPWPSSVAELHSKYDKVDVTELCERKTERTNFNCQDTKHIQSLSLWNLLLGWIYNPSQVSNREMYFGFCQYPCEVISYTRDILKHASVMTINKKIVGEGSQSLIHQGAGVIHNMVLTSRHKETMKSRYPSDVFEKALNQIQVLEAAFLGKKWAVPSISDSMDGQSRRDDRFQPDPQQAGSGDRPVDQSSTQGQRQDGEDSQEEDVYEEMDWKQYQGGSCMAVLSLYAMNMVNVKISIPNDMIRVTEDAKKMLSLRKRKRPAEDMEETANESNDEDLRPPLKSMRKIIIMQQSKSQGKQQAATTQASSSSSLSDVARERTSMSAQRDLKHVKFGDAAISFKPSVVTAVEDLASHYVSMASGTLLTLARTSVMDDLDIANSTYKMYRGLSVEPLRMKFALKGEAQAEMTQSVNEGKRDECQMEFEEGSMNRLGESRFDSFEKQSEQINVDVCTEQSSHSKVEFPLFDQSKQSGKSTRKKSCFTRISQADFSQIISRLEQVFPEDYHQTDVGQEMRTRLSGSLLEKGERLYQLIDGYGFPGVTELEIEQIQGLPFSSLKSSIKCLCNMNAIMTVGSEERRFVSRRHFREWTILTRPRGSGKDGSAPSGSSTAKYRILARPWQTLYGDVNAVYLEQALQSLLTFLYQHPGLSMEAIADKFNPQLLSSNVYELLDLLEETGCIEVTYIFKCPKMSVFGSTPRSSPHDAGWLSTSLRVVDIPMLSPIKFALLLKAIKQHCQSKEFLVHTAS